jgi:hypothetical protein
MVLGITRAGWKRILIITLVGLCIMPFTPGVKQSWNVRKAERHADKLRPLLMADARFEKVLIGGYTSAGGSLYVGGYVANDKERGELKQFVIKSNPPVKLIFMVHTLAEFEKARQRGREPVRTPSKE